MKEKCEKSIVDDCRTGVHIFSLSLFSLNFYSLHFICVFFFFAMRCYLLALCCLVFSFAVCCLLLQIKKNFILHMLILFLAENREEILYSSAPYIRRRCTLTMRAYNFKIRSRFVRTRFRFAHTRKRSQDHTCICRCVYSNNREKNEKKNKKKYVFK